VDGVVTVWLDAPTAEQGGTRLGEVALTAEAYAAADTETGTDGTVWSWIGGAMESSVGGRHGVYFVFSSESEEILCAFDQFCFEKTA